MSKKKSDKDKVYRDFLSKTTTRRGSRHDSTSLSEWIRARTVYVFVNTIANTSTVLQDCGLSEEYAVVDVWDANDVQKLVYRL